MPLYSSKSCLKNKFLFSFSVAVPGAVFAATLSGHLGNEISVGKKTGLGRGWGYVTPFISRASGMASSRVTLGGKGLAMVQIFIT